MNRDVPGAFIKSVFPLSFRQKRTLPADFSPELYLAANPDVKATGIEAAAHYLEFGVREGRKLRPEASDETVEQRVIAKTGQNSVEGCADSDRGKGLYEGYIDHVQDTSVCGWAWQQDRPDEPISIDLYVDGEHQTSTIAAGFRADLQEAGKGNGRHAFQIRLPDRYRDAKPHSIRLCFAGTDLDLQGSPRNVCIDRKPGIAYLVYDEKQRAILDERVRLLEKTNPPDNPKISVIIPCYNLGEYLDEAVDSVFEQTFHDFEIIIVNDGSTDDSTNRLLWNYSRPRTRVIQTENRGPAAARNAGIKLARGTYLCALDADDKLHPEYFEKAAGVLDDNPSVMFVSCWLQAFGDEDWVWKQQNCDLVTLLGECTVATPALVRKESVLAVGGYDEDPAQWGNEDWLLWISLVSQGCKGIILPEVLFYYRKRENSLSAFWMRGEAHLKKLQSVISKHSVCYRNHLIEVLLRKEGDICDLLRQNDAAERDIYWCKQQIQSWKSEIARLQGKLASRQRNGDVAAKLADLETQVRVKSRQLETSLIEQDQLKQHEAQLQHVVDSKQRELLAMRQSRSWIITAPLRAINARLPLLSGLKSRTK